MILSRSILLIGRILVLCTAMPAASLAQTEPFAAYLESLWPLARDRAIARQTFDAAIAGLRPDPEVLALTRRQPEFGKPLGDYIAGAVTAARIAQGAKLAQMWAAPLAKVRETFGVDPLVVVAIWGIETHFGTVPTRKDVFRSLSTLAHARYRDDFFRDEFLAALAILQNENIPRARMTGSWAGAMGQAQFIPSSYLKYAVDFSQDGRKDIWTDVPDVLGSIANYLAKSGWQRDLPWGYEVVLPADFDYRRSRGSFREWAALGVKRAASGALPTQSDAVLLFPSGANGPAFLVTANYLAIRAYNNSDGYTLSVAHLADRMRGGKPFVAPWPTDDPQLPRADRIALLQGQQFRRTDRLRLSRFRPRGAGQSRLAHRRPPDRAIARLRSRAADAAALRRNGGNVDTESGANGTVVSISGLVRSHRIVQPPRSLDPDRTAAAKAG